MQININTDNHITNSEKFSEELRAKTEHDLNKFKTHITRVEVFFQDENGSKGGIDDKKCSIEVRLEGLKPLAASSHGATLREAHSSASHKVQRLVKDILAKQRGR